MADDYILINQVVVGIFIALTLLLGLRVKRAKTMEEYALAGRSLGGGVILMTLVATLISSLDIILPYSFAKGVTILTFSISSVSMILLLGWYVLPKLKNFPKCHTISDVMTKIYGKKVGQMTVALGTLASVVMIVSQFCFTGEMASMIGMEPKIAILILGLLVTLYTFIGSIRAVAITDVLQFGCILFGTITFTILSLNSGKPILQAGSSFAKHHSFWNHPHLFGRFLRGFFWGLWPTLLILPPVIQRVLMIRKKKSIQTTFLGISFIFAAFHLLTFTVGIYLAKRHRPLPSDKLTVVHIVKLVCENPIGRAAMLLTILSILMSTIDSFLNAASVELGLALRRAFPKRVPEKQAIRWSSVFTLFLGLMTTGIALSLNKFPNEVMGFVVFFYAILVVPFLAGVLSFKGDRKVFGITLLTYIALFGILFATLDKQMVLNVVGASKRKSARFDVARMAWLIAILGSTVVFFVAHYLVHGRFVIIDRSQNNWEKRHKISIQWTWLTSPAKWARAKVAQYGMEPYALGVFLYISFMIPYLHIGGSQAHVDATGSFISILRGVGALLVTILLLESRWPKCLRPYFPLYYYLTIFYCVPFVAVMATFQDAQGGFTVSNLVLAIILLILLVDWRTFLGFFFFAGLFATSYFKVDRGFFFPDFGKGGTFVISVNVLYSLIVCLIFARKKQLHSYLKTRRLTQANQNREAKLQVQEAAHYQLAMSVDARSGVMSEMESIVKRQEKGVFEKEDAAKLRSVMNHLTDIQRRSMEYLPLQPTEGSVHALLHNLLEEMRIFGIEDNIHVISHLAEAADTIVADLPYIQKLLLNAVQHQAKYHPGIEAYCHIGHTNIQHGMPGKEKSIPAYQITLTQRDTAPTKKQYAPSDKMQLFTQDARHLSDNYRIVAAHYGAMHVGEGSEGCTQTYVIPSNIHDIRPKTSLLTDDDVHNITTLDAPEDKGFLKQVKAKGLPMAPIEKALKICKHYHRHQFRKSGEPYYLHPMAVATILLDYTKDLDILVASLLHDVVEDTVYTHHQIAALFNEQVAVMVSEVSNIYNRENRKIKLAKQDKFAHMLATANPKSLLVKLADRLHNMRTLEGHKESKRRTIAQETIDFFIPVAKKLGYKKIEQELIEWCSKYLPM